MKKLIRLAKKIAVKDDCRQYRFGVVGVRRGGTIVVSRNIPTRHPEPRAHAEARVVRKLNRGSTIYVVRIDRKNRLTTARPCKDCQMIMKSSGVKRCFYSISETEFGVLEL